MILIRSTPASEAGVHHILDHHNDIVATSMCESQFQIEHSQKQSVILTTDNKLRMCGFCIRRYAARVIESAALV